MGEPVIVRAGQNPHDRKEKARSILPRYDYVDDLVNMACDLVDIPKLDPKTPKNYVARSLVETGGVGFFDTRTFARGFYFARPQGVPIRYDEFDEFQFYDRGGLTSFSVTRANGARYIRANAKGTPPKAILERFSIMLDLCDRSIASNIRAQILGRVVGDKKGKDGNSARIDTLLASFETGLSVGLDPETLANLQPVDLSVAPTFDRVLAARAAIWSDAMQRVGSVAAMQYSRERTQSAEVNAYIATTIDLVYMMINTFNADCKRQKILGTDNEPLQMVYTGYAARFDEDPRAVQRTEPQTEPREDTEGGENNAAV